MKEHPILFSTDMVKSIFAKIKKMTRRVEKKATYDMDIVHFDDKRGIATLQKNGQQFKFYCPYGRVGDILWVRETWTEHEGKILYKANVPYPFGTTDTKWKPSIFMPRQASRIQLMITDIRFERLQDITNKDAFEEGFVGVPCDCINAGVYGCTDCHNTGYTEPPILGFMETWDHLNEKRGYSWATNPWVWVIEFKIKRISK